MILYVDSKIFRKILLIIEIPRSNIGNSILHSIFTISLKIQSILEDQDSWHFLKYIMSEEYVFYILLKILKSKIDEIMRV